MQFNRRRFIGAAIAASAAAGASSALFARSTPASQPLVPAIPKLAEKPPLLQEALAALDRHGPRIGRRDRIGLVDFSLHSAELRFHLVDVESGRSEEHTSELQSRENIVCRLLLEQKTIPDT